MRPAFRKAFLTLHLASALGWLGADAGFFVLALVGLSSPNIVSIKAAYISMETIGWYVIVPLAFASLGTGLILALRTQWGVFRHYWVIAKLALTIGGTVFLLAHTQAMGVAAMHARDPELETRSALLSHLAASHAGGHLGNVQLQLAVAAGGGLLLLLGITATGIFKPKGLTLYGKRKQRERVAAGRH
ncbi:MAG TPA: hypothetical protein VF493_21000 [Terriglobales bacterium]